jgi:hypothetical protein
VLGPPPKSRCHPPTGSSTPSTACAGHVRLVGVACARGYVGQVLLFAPSRKPEEPLEAKHAVQRLESVAEGIQALAAQGALTQVYMRRQLIELESRGHAVVACGPAQERDPRVGDPNGGQSADEQGFEVRGQLFRAATCRGSIEQARRIFPPELSKRYSDIHDLTQRLAQPSRGRAGMEAHSHNDRAAPRGMRARMGRVSGPATQRVSPVHTISTQPSGTTCSHSLRDPERSLIHKQRTCPRSDAWGAHSR